MAFGLGGRERCSQPRRKRDGGEVEIRIEFKIDQQGGKLKMQNEPNKQKQEADEDGDPKNVEIDGFTAEELGAASAYTDSTEMAQQMRRGDETIGDPNARDVVGAPDAATDDRKAVPRHQRGADDQADKNFDTKEN